MNKLIKILSITGLTWFIPLVRIAAGENLNQQLRQLWLVMGVPIVAFALFLGAWSISASGVNTALGAIPGPLSVWDEVGGLVDEHFSEQQKKQEFYQRQQERNAARLAEDPAAEIKVRPYNGKPTYLDKILTSLRTVFAGFVIASLIAIPIGILCGMSPVMNTAINPLIQIFKPVSPLAWLPIVTLVVSAVYVTTDDSLLPKSFVTSAITVTLCSLWPTLINTAVGVSSIDRDLVNVAKVLRLDWHTQIRRIILPSALPYIFTGMRLSLGVGWIVLIAAEMLAQNPGLGKFVWDEFQNGSSNSLGRIMVAVFTIGIIGFILDRIMQSFQNLFSFSKA